MKVPFGLLEYISTQVILIHEYAENTNNLIHEYAGNTNKTEAPLLLSYVDLVTR